MDEFDVICLGGGVCGEAVAGELRGSGLTMAVIERELVGGECPYWGCIPSKTLASLGRDAGRGARRPHPGGEPGRVDGRLPQDLQTCVLDGPRPRRLQCGEGDSRATGSS